MISRETIRRGFPIKPLGEVAEFLDSRRRPITASEGTVNLTSPGQNEAS